jgi:hypothetical protein
MTSTQKKVMDVVFLIDATGSMSGAIQAAHDKATEMAINLRVKNSDVDFMFGSVCYRDPIDSPPDVHQVHNLNRNIDSLVKFLSGVTATGGGDGPEDWVGAYKHALNSMSWRDGAKTIIHIADAPAHGKAYCGSDNHEKESPKLRPLIETVAKRGILISAIDLNYGASGSFIACKEIYDRAGGCKFSIEELSLNGYSVDISCSGGRARSRKDSVRCDTAPSRRFHEQPSRARKTLYSSAPSTRDRFDESTRSRDAAATIGPVLGRCTESACDDALKRFYS